jgi:hypothetical protein
MKRLPWVLPVAVLGPRPPDWPEGGRACLIVGLVEFRPGRGTVATTLYTNISPNPNYSCLYPDSPDLVRVGPDRRRATFRDVYMPYDDEYGNVVWVRDTAFADDTVTFIPDGIILPPEVSAFRRGSYGGVPAFIFHLKEEGRCVAE